MPDTITYDPLGRMGIGVEQGRQAPDYPLILPSADIRYLLADMQYTYAATTTAIVYPLRIHWLYGFGTDTGTGDGTPLWTPTPTHAQDIQLVDAQNQLVFDSTADGVTLQTRTWGSRFVILTWQQTNGDTVQVIRHTAWSEDLDPPPQLYPETLYPLAAELDPRVIYQIPQRLRAVIVNGQTFTDTDIELHAGYNMQLTVQPPATTAVGRPTTRIVFQAVPGAGDGIFPGCDPPPLTLRSLNGIGPTDTGNLYLAASACYAIRQPTRVTGSLPRRTMPQINLYPGNQPDYTLPAENAGQSKASAGWPLGDSPAYAHLQLVNDCLPCCDCEDYANVALYMNQQQARYAFVGNMLQRVRTKYHKNRSDWIEQARCEADKPLKLGMLPQRCPQLDVVLQYCNQTDKCQTDLELSVTFDIVNGSGTATPVPGYSALVGGPDEGSGIRKSRINIGGSWPTFSAFADVIPPRMPIRVLLRLDFSNCGLTGGGDAGVPLRVEGTLTATLGTTPIKTTADVPAAAVAVTTLLCPASLSPTIDMSKCGCPTNDAD